MPTSLVHTCECPNCQHSTPHPDQSLHQQINLFLSRLDEQQRRWYMGMEVNRRGRASLELLSQISGLCQKTIERGQLELQADLASRPTQYVRLSGAGRKLAEKKTRLWKRPSKH